MKPTLVVLAAGMGRRYGGLKQLDPVGPSGETLMDYSIFDAVRSGFGDVVFVIRREIESEFQETLGRKYERHFPVRYAFQDLDQLPEGFQVPEGRKKPWGTGQALLAVEPLVAHPMAVINADDFYGADSFRTLAAFLKAPQEGKTYSMIGFTLRDTLSEHGSVARAVCRVDPRGFLEEIAEITRIEKDGADAVYQDAGGHSCPLAGDSMVSLNMWGFTPSVFPLFREEFRRFLHEHGQDPDSEFYIPTGIQSLLRRRKVRVQVLPTRDSWFGMTYPEDKPEVVRNIQALISKGVYPEKLWNGS